MMTWDSSTLNLKRLLKQTDETCPIHGVNLVTFNLKGAPAITECPLCGRERVNEKTKRLEELGGELVEKQDSYDWLAKRSILTDTTLKRATFDSYREIDETTKKAKYQTRHIAGEYLKGAKYNTILTGKAGTGKSHLAMAMLKAVNEHSKPYKRCLFVSVGDWLSQIKASYSDKTRPSEASLIELLTDADVLVIDDLGAESGSISDYGRVTDNTSRLLFSVMNARRGKPTIITTNLTSEQMQTMYDQRLMSRMVSGTAGHVINLQRTADKRLIWGA